MSITKDQIIEAVAAMSVMDIVELIADMEKKFGVSVAVNALNSSARSDLSTDVTETIEEKDEFNVILKTIGTNKIAVIKAVRSAIGLGLKEAKDLVESAPVILKEKISKNDAEALKKSLEEAGAEIEIK